MTELFIRRPVMTTLVMLAILLFGVMGYRSLPVSDLPNVDFPTILVTASLPGASPETMASSVATPLEKQFSTIAGLDTMTSVSSIGSSQIAPWWCWIMKMRKSRSNSLPLAWSSWCSWASLSMPGMSISCSSPFIVIFIPVAEGSGTGWRRSRSHCCIRAISSVWALMIRWQSVRTEGPAPCVGAQPAITSNASRVQWIDNGQPKTLSAPSTEAQRFYRVIVLP